MALSAMALSACVTVGTEDALAPSSTPGDWAAVSEEMALAGTEAVTRDWLAELSDPTITPLIAEAIAYNNDLAASAARVRALLAQARIQRADLLPQVTAGLGAGRFRTQAQGSVQGGQLVSGGEYGSAISSEIRAQWDVDLWGRLTDLTRSAYYDFDAQRLDYAAAALSIAGNTAQLYYQLTEARLQRELAERDVDAGEANLRIIERRYDRGISSSLDVRLARASLAQSQAQLIAREQTERELARQLEVILGRYPGASIGAADGLPELTVFVSGDGGVIGVGDPNSLLFRRPDVLAAEAQLASAGLQVSAARKALLPSFSLTASISGQGNSQAIRDRETGRRIDTIELDSGDIFDLNRLAKNVFAQVAQPIFQGGRLRANVAAQRAQMEAAVYTYAQTVLDAYREVEDAIAAERLLAAQLDARRLAFEEAVAAEELTERQYLNGTTNIFNLISAQQRRIGNESQFIAASRARLTNRIALYLALGAPFEVPAYVRPDAGERFTPPSRDPAPGAAEVARAAVRRPS